MFETMKLIDYAKEQGGTGTIGCPVLAAVAASAGCGLPTLYMIGRGHKQPSAKLAAQIQNATNARVTVHDLRPDVFGEAPTEAEHGEEAA